MEMGEKIRYLRTNKGMTLEQLGNKVGVGKSTVRKWENGMIANMRRDKIAKIAEALDVSPGYLMGWEKELTEEELKIEIRSKSSFPLNLSDEERDIIEAYKMAEEYKKQAVADLLGVKREDTTKAEDSSSISSQAG